MLFRAERQSFHRLLLASTRTSVVVLIDCFQPADVIVRVRNNVNIQLTRIAQMTRLDRSIEAPRPGVQVARLTA